MIRYTPTQSLDNNSEGLDLTPLIDVVFTLIIFLILTMGTTQVMTEIQLTRSKKDTVATELKDQTIVIEVNHLKQHWKVENTIFKKFEPFTQFFLVRFSDRSHQPVVLALERTLPVEELISLMDFLARNGFSNIQIASKWTI